MLVDIKGKVTVITGAGRAIGEGLAHRFADERARLVLLERNGESLEKVASAIRAKGVEVEAVACDIGSEKAVSDAIGRAVKRFGGIDVLINNAGVGHFATVETLTVEQWDDTFAANARGVFLCSQAVIPHMKRQKWGRIINASSFAAIIPSYASAAYAASKAAVVSLTRVLAAELGPWNVTVNCYAPGMVPSPLNNFADAPVARQQQLLDTLSVRRWETADDVASLLIFLASEHAAYITGALIDVSGGKFTVQFPRMAYDAAAAEAKPK